MTALNLERIEREVFTLAPEVEGSRLVVRFIGTGDMSALPVLDDYLKQVDSEMQRLELREAVIDLRQLDLMNSSCFKAFVFWIYRVMTGPKYSIRFLGNSGLPWQTNTLGAFQRFGPGVVAIEGASG